MRPLKRQHTNKRSSSKTFRNNTRKTHNRNMAAPMRGGIRL